MGHNVEQSANQECRADPYDCRLRVTQLQCGGGFMIPKMQLWAGRTMSILASLFLMVDGVMKLLKPPLVVKATT